MNPDRHKLVPLYPALLLVDNPTRHPLPLIFAEDLVRSSNVIFRKKQNN